NEDRSKIKILCLRRIVNHAQGALNFISSLNFLISFILSAFETYSFMRYGSNGSYSVSVLNNDASLDSTACIQSFINCFEFFNDIGFFGDWLVFAT
ncbi:MAG: hypothetical protein ACXAD7_10790, partial [Candidatus Kariarchaeaceae archaeon]